VRGGTFSVVEVPPGQNALVVSRCPEGMTAISRSLHFSTTGMELSADGVSGADETGVLREWTVVAFNTNQAATSQISVQALCMPLSP